MGQKLSRGNE